VTFIFTVIFPVLAGIVLLAAFYFIARGFVQRAQRTRQPYGVGQQEIRRAMQVDFIRGFAAAIVGLLLLLASGLGSLTQSAVSSPAEAPTQVIENGPGSEPDGMATSTPTVVVTATSTPTITPTATPAEPTVTPTMTATPTATPQPEPETAVVQSGVGIWLRSAPSSDSEQLEWLLDGTVLTLLPGFEVGAEFEWQEVRAPSGQEGWVAAEFIIYDTDLPDEPDEPEDDELEDQEL
jgi:hypothetical protein